MRQDHNAVSLVNPILIGAMQRIVETLNMLLQPRWPGNIQLHAAQKIILAGALVEVGRQ